MLLFAKTAPFLTRASKQHGLSYFCKAKSKQEASQSQSQRQARGKARGKPDAKPEASKGQAKGRATCKPKANAKNLIKIGFSKCAKLHAFFLPKLLRF